MTAPEERAQPRPLSEKVGPLLLLLALSLVRGLLYLAIIPPWQGPDEPRHFEYARLIADRGRLVTKRDLSPALQEGVIRSMVEHDFWRFGFAYYGYDPARPPQAFEEIWPGDFAHQVHQPPLYYIGAALAARLAPGDDVQADLYAMRLYSLFLGLLTLIVIYRAAGELFPEDPALRLAIPAFVALLPMRTFLTSMVSNDNLAELLVSMLLWRAVRLIRLGLTPGRALEVVLWAGVSVFSKLTALVAIPLALLALLLASGIPWEDAAARGRALRRLGAGAGSLAAIGALLLFSAGSAHPLWSAPGRFLRIPREAALYLMGGDYARALLATPYGTYLTVMFRSFWGLFGWLNVPMASAAYGLLGGATAVVALGLARGFLRARRTRALPNWQWRALWLCALSPILAIVIVLGKEVLFLTYLEGGLPHGRYLFPVIFPIATLFTLGLRAWMPASRRTAFLVGLLAGLFLLDAWALWGTVIPFYYG